MSGGSGPNTPGAQRPAGLDDPVGSGPLAGAEPTGGPIDDPSMADRANPRWDDPTSPQPDAQGLTNQDGTPDVMPPDSLAVGPAVEDDPADPAAWPLEGRDEPGSDNIREGRGSGTPNPALAEGGDHG
jgi:hypothetical protein